ncbi:hypothetical protein KZX50_24840 [Bacillus infantis]|uniref:hypothetical protein n=1 Tax=Bacillus infantis TaxID=324767 RepID=UPI002002B347|nr:hypothetical protein [Bacillus infantis]MCK6208649.1 hypothetical protein [Bacillus infantis]
MYIIVDESLGLPKELLKGVHIRKTQLKKDSSLEEAIEKGKSSIFGRKLPIKMRSRDQELEELSSLMDENKEMLYIYDSYTTNKGTIKRIMNWKYPDKRLVGIDGSKNKAFAVYLLLIAGEGTLEEYFDAGRLNMRKLTIVNNKKYSDSGNYLILKEKKHKQYYLFNGQQDKAILSGDKKEMVEEIVRSSQAGHMILASRAKLDVDAANAYIYQIENAGLPQSTDVVDIFIAGDLPGIGINDSHGVTDR